MGKLNERNRQNHFIKNFLYDFFEGIILFLGFFAGVAFGYFVELFGEVALTIAMQLRLEAIFAHILDNKLFT